MNLIPILLLSVLSAICFGFGEDDEDKTYNAFREEWCGKGVNCYDILEVPSSANYSEIKASYKRLSKEMHPDVCKNCDGTEMQAINNAYKILSTPPQRDMYDKVMKLKRSMDSPQESIILVAVGVFGLCCVIVKFY